MLLRFMLYLVNLAQFDHINQMITITVTILNSDHCKQTFLVLNRLFKGKTITLIDSESVVS